MEAAASEEAATKGPSSPVGETLEASMRAAAAQAEKKATADGAPPAAVKAAGEAAAKSRASGKTPYDASRDGQAAQKAAQKVLKDGMSPEAAKVAAERAVAARGLGMSPMEVAKEVAAAAKATQAALDSGASPETAKAAGEAAGNAIRSGKSVVEAAGEDANKGKSPEAAKAAGESAAKARSAGKLPRVIANDEGSATELAVGDKGGAARSSKTLRDLAREQGLTVEDVLDQVASAQPFTPRKLSSLQQQQRIGIDLRVASNEQLEEAVARLRAEVESRKKPDPSLLALQVEHISHELAVPPTRNRRLSLEHLELYERFCSRIPPEASPAELGDLVQRIAKAKAVHPDKDFPRSGDRDDGNDEPASWESAVLKVPEGRRRQTMVMLYCNLLTGPLLVLATVALLWWLLRPLSPYLFALYCAWVYYDNKTRPNPSTDRLSPGWRDASIWRLMRDYFPMRRRPRSTNLWWRLRTPSCGSRHTLAHPDAKFDASRSYLFCYHPHGVQSSGAFSMSTAASGFDELFPALPPTSVQTLTMNFYLPMTRENLMALNCGDASARCLKNVLSRGGGSSAVLVTGGARESMLAHPYHSTCVLLERKGFVKIALQTGAALVPMWGFGENNLYENMAIDSPTIRRWQQRIQRALTFAPLLVAGRGVFSYTGGLMPRRRPITVVIGDPIDVGAAEAAPSAERIAQVHAKYILAVKELHARYKEIYDPKAQPVELV